MTDLSTILLLILMGKHNNEKNITFRDGLVISAKRRRHCIITRRALLNTATARFPFLFSILYDQSLITITSIDEKNLLLPFRTLPTIVQYVLYSPYSSYVQYASLVEAIVD